MFGFGGGDLVSVRIDTDELVAKLDRMGANSKNLPLDAFAALAIAEVDDVIQSEGVKGTDGQWDPLSSETLRRWPRRRGGKLLQDTGALANIQVAKVEEQSFTLASPKDYAKFHVTGTRNMPKRDFFALDFASLMEQFGELALEEIKR